MIEKFNEYIKDKGYPKKITDFIIWEDVDDQFLRIKELFEFDVSCYHYERSDKYTIYIREHRIKNSWPTGYVKNPNRSKIENELNQIKKRIESMRPGIVMTWENHDLKHADVRSWTVSITSKS